MKKYILLLIILIVIIFGFLAWKYPFILKEGSKEVASKSAKVGTIPNGYILDSTLFKDNSYFVFLSPDGRNNFLYLKKGKDFYSLNINGKEVGTYDYDFDSFVAIGLPTFSNDGTHFVYSTKSGKKCLVVLDEKEVGIHENCARISSVISSSNGQRFAYILNNLNSSLKDSGILIVDGKEIKKNISVGALAFSPDGQRFAFTESREEGLFFIVDGKEFGPTQEEYMIDIPGVTFSPDSQHFAFTIFKEGKNYFSLDGKEIGIPNSRFSNFSSDGNPIYIKYNSLIDQGEWFALVNGKEMGPYDSDYIEKFFSNKNIDSRVKRKVDESGKFYLVIDGKEGKHYSEVSDDVIFSSNGQRFAYVADASDIRYMNPVDDDKDQNIKETLPKLYLVLDGKEIGPYFNFNNFGFNVFSPDSQHFSYIMQKEEAGKWFIILDGKEKKYDEIFYHSFDSESKYLYYIARKGNEIWRIVDKVE